MFVSRKVVSGKSLSRLSCICLALEKLVNEKHFPDNGKHFPFKEKFGLVSRKSVFLLFWAENTFWIVKSLEMSYYLLIISNLVLKFLIVIYILF
jgi:hypothetical protein